MTCWSRYYTPVSIGEALNLLAQHQGAARIIGGGTDLLLEIQQGHRPPVEALVDLSRAEGLGAIREEDGWLVVGAAVTHSQIVRHPAIRAHGTCLAESCGVIGGPQVRNVATLAGNIAHALPAGDGTLGLLALGGEAQVASLEGTLWHPLHELYRGPGESSVDPTRMLISAMRFRPTGTGEGSAFRRVMRPQGVALPIIGMAARVELAGDTIESARVVLGPAGSVPFVAGKTMAFLKGKTAEDSTYRAAADVALEEAHLRTSKHRATDEYRRLMISGELPRTLAKAADRARGGEAVPEGIGA